MASNKQNLSQVLTTKEVADILKCSPDTVNNLFRSGKMKGFKMGRWKTTRRNVYDYINNSCK